MLGLDFSPLDMVDARWTLLVGVPIIVVLLGLAWRRTRALVARIREVREEMARSPQDPYQALSVLMEEKQGRERDKRGGKR
jgi:hypothetical protein